jgi:predicted RNA-binding protein associated with RNAse of E/G family
MHAVWLFWDENWNRTNWFVNLQAPHARTPAGIRVTDYYLDLERTPDLDWRWKDEDEFAALLKRIDRLRVAHG